MSMAAERSRARGRPPRPCIFTREVLEVIPYWVEMGATRAEIAGAIGVTVGTLNTMCSRHRISLARSAKSVARALPPDCLGRVRREAERRGLVVPDMVAQIVRAVAEHNLFSAVLGDFDDEGAG